MNAPALLVTIDTEGDDQWRREPEVRTENAAFLPRFQALCDRFGFPPTYLTNHEMALDDRFVAMAQDAVDAGNAEVGMHLHSWTTPPLVPRTEDDSRHHPYLVEFPDDVVEAKVGTMTDVLTERFGRPRSHRAGRWAFDARYARVLDRAGYTSDCSVTPHVSWRGHPGAPDGAGGTDYTGFPEEPYFLDLDDVRRAGTSRLLEVPMTVRSRLPRALHGLHGVWSRMGRPGRLVNGRTTSWLRPNGRNLGAMERTLGLRADAGYAMFMLHSSEFMPGGSPTFRDAASIEALYRDLEALFEHARRLGYRGETLTGFRGRHD